MSDIVAAVATLLVGQGTLAKYRLLSRRTRTLVDWAELISHSENSHLREIITEAMEQGGAHPKLYREFWAILSKNGPLPPGEVQNFRDMTTGTVPVYQRYFYQDALRSLRSGTPYKSTQRDQYEEYLLSMKLITKWRIRENDQLIATIAAGKPIPYEATTVVMDEGRINHILTSLAMAEQSLDRLFTPHNPCR